MRRIKRWLNQDLEKVLCSDEMFGTFSRSEEQEKHRLLIVLIVPTGKLARNCLFKKKRAYAIHFKFPCSSIFFLFIKIIIDKLPEIYLRKFFTAIKLHGIQKLPNHYLHLIRLAKT